MNRKVIFTGCTAVCLAMGFTVLNQYFTGGYEIVAEGKTLGIITDTQQFTSVLSAVNEQLSIDFGDNAQLEPEVQLKSCLVTKDQVTSQWELYENIAAMSDYMAKACTLVIGGKKTISFRSREDLEKALQILQDKYWMENSVVKPQEDLSMDMEYISVADLYSVEDGAEYLEESGLLHVLTVQETQYQASVEYKTIEQQDNSLYLGQRRTIQEGQAGAYLIRAKTEYVDGIEVSKSILSETLIHEAEDEIVGVGTKPLPAEMGTGTFIMPTNGRISSGFGARWGRTHTGMDIAAANGTEIYAADNGVVSFTGEKGSYGNLVKIDHQNGYETYYAHCSKILAAEGDIVQKGQQIALVGNTGNSTGPHCHFEIRYYGKPQNPSDFVK